MPDKNAEEEPDRSDETWLAFDRQIVDDELYALWGKFKPGVRIIVLSDSCHSGTVLRRIDADVPNPVATREASMCPLAPEANSIRKVVASSFSTSCRGAFRSAPLP